MTDADIARKAADLIAEHGLAKKTLCAPPGQLCHNGAVMAAIVGYARFYRAYRSGQHDVGLFCHPDFRRIVRASSLALEAEGLIMAPHEYNNLPETTGEDVILLLKKAAEILEAPGALRRPGPEGSQPYRRAWPRPGGSHGQRGAPVPQRGRDLRCYRRAATHRMVRPRRR